LVLRSAAVLRPIVPPTLLPFAAPIGASAAMLLPPTAAVTAALTAKPPTTGLSKFLWLLMTLPAPHAC